MEQYQKPLHRYRRKVKKKKERRIRLHWEEECQQLDQTRNIILIQVFQVLIYNKCVQKKQTERNKKEKEYEMAI